MQFLFTRRKVECHGCVSRVKSNTSPTLLHGQDDRGTPIADCSWIGQLVSRFQLGFRPPIISRIPQNRP